MLQETVPPVQPIAPAGPHESDPGRHRGSARTSVSQFLWRWGVVTLAGAVVLSTLDALLLQRSRSYFTGGFLSIDHLRGPADIAVFLALSLVADGALVGVLAGLVMWMLCRQRVRASACVVAGLLAGLGPPIVANFISYQLGRYLGDAADLALMFELTGGSIPELFAVASSHLLTPGLVVAGAIIGAGGLIWVIHRWSPRERAMRASAKVLWVPGSCALAALVVATGASASSDTMENGLLRKPAGKVLAFVADGVSDIDRDGFGIAGRLSDPDAFNPLVFPYGLDIPGNGVDEDGVGGDLPSGEPAYIEPPGPSSPWARRPDVVLIVLESFRADLVGARHNGRPVTPVLEALAARGVSSSRAYSHNGYTSQSRFHLLSGSLAGVRDGRTLIDDFNAKGYLTAYFSGQDESFAGPEHSIGFERAGVAYDARVDAGRRYSTFTTPGSLAVPFGVVQERIDETLRTHGTDDKPIFLYVNFHDTHFPYTHDSVRTLISPVRLARPRIAPAERDALWATYANTAGNVDRAVGQVLDAVRRARGSDPAVIVTSDHGESLFDEGFLGHGYALNDVQTRIPFIVANLPMIVAEPFAQRDLRDALAAALGVSAAAPSTPRLQEEKGREVFQYLGNLNRPRQIAFLRDGERTIYDFRSRRVSVTGGSWRRPVDLTSVERVEFLRLIRDWERMSLAYHSARLKGETIR